MTMRNVGTVDAAIRIVVGLGLLVTAGFLNERPLLVLGAGALAVLVLGTGLTRSCPLYLVFGTSTLRIPKTSRSV